MIIQYIKSIRTLGIICYLIANNTIFYLGKWVYIFLYNGYYVYTLTILTIQHYRILVHYWFYNAKILYSFKNCSPSFSIFRIILYSYVLITRLTFFQSLYKDALTSDILSWLFGYFTTCTTRILLLTIIMKPTTSVPALRSFNR